MVPQAEDGGGAAYDPGGMRGDSPRQAAPTTRVAVLADAHTDWAPAVAAGIAERHTVLALTVSSGIWFLGSNPLGSTRAASAGAAMAMLGTADVVLPLDPSPPVLGLARVSGLPCGQSPTTADLAADWWTVRLVAEDAGVSLPAGIRVGRHAARALDYLGPVTIRPGRPRAPGPRRHITDAADLAPALEHALSYADHAVVEETPVGEVVTVALVRRPDGAVAVSTAALVDAVASIASTMRAPTTITPTTITPTTPAPTTGASASLTAPALATTTATTTSTARDPWGLQSCGGRSGARPPHTSDCWPECRPVDRATPAADRERIDRAALTLMTALGAHGLVTMSFVVDDGPPVLVDLDVLPDLGPRSPAIRLLRSEGTRYADLLDLLVSGARP